MLLNVACRYIDMLFTWTGSWHSSISPSRFQSILQSWRPEHRAWFVALVGKASTAAFPHSKRPAATFKPHFVGLHALSILTHGRRRNRSFNRVFPKNSQSQTGLPPPHRTRVCWEMALPRDTYQVSVGLDLTYTFQGRFRKPREVEDEAETSLPEPQPALARAPGRLEGPDDEAGRVTHLSMITSDSQV